eukprot:CAMPEP_0184870576 /NCGR_PEP_ID=MMETSP0580-20130426/37972_1 /TAXON_ID=1118495 /ORGANISM="Dactyliosolen fragilissimus" /LENGTH=314 /DNA_ID=CAMNT_0027372723 /DNA_START=23 /DNA_END=967 /DNA_ORIENTATION=+
MEVVPSWFEGVLRVGIASTVISLFLINNGISSHFQDLYSESSNKIYKIMEESNQTDNQIRHNVSNLSIMSSSSSNVHVPDGNTKLNNHLSGDNFLEFRSTSLESQLHNFFLNLGKDKNVNSTARCNLNEQFLYNDSGMELDWENKSSARGKAFSWILDDEGSTGNKVIDQNPTLAQRYILALLFFSTDGVLRSNDSRPSESWTKHGALHFLDSNYHECDWYRKISGTKYGVMECDSNKQVTKLFLPELSLQGTLPSEIGYLSKLVSLDLLGNFIGGTVPASIGCLKKLEVLSLSNNNFSGTLPKSMGQMTNLSK